MGPGLDSKVLFKHGSIWNWLGGIDGSPGVCFFFLFILLSFSESVRSFGNEANQTNGITLHYWHTCRETKEGEQQQQQQQQQKANMFIQEYEQQFPSLIQPRWNSFTSVQPELAHVTGIVTEFNLIRLRYVWRVVRHLTRASFHVDFQADFQVKFAIGLGVYMLHSSRRIYC